MPERPHRAKSRGLYGRQGPLPGVSSVVVVVRSVAQDAWGNRDEGPTEHPHLHWRWHLYLSLRATAHATLPRCVSRRRRQHGHGDGAAGGPPRTQLRIRVYI
eukprot:scaffold5611_cov132-Isochrysis_galbana.AAC.16